MFSWSSKVHRWIALIIALQALGWVFGGLVMTAIPIGLVRGESHIATPALAPIDLAKVVPLAKQLALAETTGLGSATLKNTPRGPIWVIKSSAGSEGWWNAYTGENLEEIKETDARRFAQAAYRGAGKLQLLRYEEVAPKEAQISGPLWMAQFSDPESSRLYLDSFTGETLSRRSNLWQFYDFFYQIHIMNFGADRNYNHPLIIAAAAATLFVVVSGFVLLWVRIGQDFRAVVRRRARTS